MICQSKDKECFYHINNIHLYIDTENDNIQVDIDVVSISIYSRGRDMAYEFYNPNPCGKYVEDCVVRAITKVLNLDWDTAYWDIAMKGFDLCNRPDSNSVWGAYLQDHGFIREPIISDCPELYNIRDFSEDHPKGTYVLCTGTHVVAQIDGTYYDTADSGSEIPVFYWVKKKEQV